MSNKLGSILVIDDDEGILMTLRILLKRHFQHIITEHSPEKITHMLNQKHFHVVLLDMNFSVGATSGKEGFFWLNKVREISPASSPVLMTAYGDIDLAIKAMKDGAFDFVIKPWNNDKLIHTLTEAYKQSLMKKGMIDSPVESKAESTPVSEAVTRIFMFLDIKSSTAIAEKLGHVKYFELLNDFFSDISTPIHEHDGEIYQYVGDQVVVSWPFEAGISSAKCLNCFFHICDKINMSASTYRQKFGLIPNFKAGMHFGQVSMGSVGTIKREVVYTGDVLNTAARIESLCNRYKVDLLLSKELLEELPLSESVSSTEIGEIYLRGKQTSTTLYHVQRIKQI